MEKGIAPIPAFYACYLLRSIARHSSLYIGSTPNPPRRLKQHNGDAGGGAKRTSKDSLRPWEISCLVTGFPSKIAALQFEWAWQNPNLTRHIAPDNRITQTKMTSRISPKTGRVRKRSARPRLSLTDRLANLHLLLRANSFERWPLKLTFYSEDVHRVWMKLPGVNVEKLRTGIDVVMDERSRVLPAAPKIDDTNPPATAVGIQALDVGYSGIKSQLEKSQSLFAEGHNQDCAICKKGLPSSGAGTLFCPSTTCDTVAHIQCLSDRFLRHVRDKTAMVPTHGDCPGCGNKLQWVQLVKELTIRMRGEKEFKALFKPKRGKKNAAAKSESVIDESSADEDDPLDLVLVDEEDDHFHELPESSDEDVPKIRSDSSPGHAAFKRLKTMVTFSEPVIEDSDPDDVDLLRC
ncbi:hypothetical protein DOTSEDRAFT_174260 [Dothistroma septosporum NZE10]|uniref:GIY-YIG domain-containing protein n=1 Tax=Dothistroma septosporum (strain NZE10 / CBS 128990) TaxID=675120 RepID=M2YN84_DOTSN|nr:hypothetical protein DOTSEDRAFT_174260 [Dothistroma septosporum NZE10]